MSNQEIIQRYLDSSKDISDLNDQMAVTVEDCNLSLSDLDHFLELEELSESQMMILVKKRKAILEERRSAKDNIRVIDQILPKQLPERTTMDRYLYAVNGLKDRVYTPKRIQLSDALGGSA